MAAGPICIDPEGSISPVGRRRPSARRFLGAEKVIDGGEDVGMGIQMEEADFSPPASLPPPSPWMMPPVIEWSPPIDTGRAPLASMSR